jgi:hypothetical protein
MTLAPVALVLSSMTRCIDQRLSEPMASVADTLPGLLGPRRQSPSLRGRLWSWAWWLSDRQAQASPACHEVSSQPNFFTVTPQSACTASLNFNCHRS